MRFLEINLSQPFLISPQGIKNNKSCNYVPRRTRRTSLITETQCIMRQIPPINRHVTESPKSFFFFYGGKNHDPSTSFPYGFLCNLLQKFMRTHNKYGVIMPRLVQTLRDCSSTFRSVDPYPGALSGALDFGSLARICKWVALGLKFISSPIQNH